MKKLIITSFIIFTSLSSFAQFTQGNLLVGGDFSARFGKDKVKDNNSSTDLSNYSSVGFNPKVGYFVIDNLAVGAGINVGMSSSKAKAGGNKTNSTGLAIVPFVRYYLPAKIYGQAQIGFGSSKNKSTFGNNTTEVKNSTLQWSLAAGYAWFLTESVAIEPQVGYGSYRTKAKDNNPNDARSIEAGMFINVGFQVYLAKK